MRHRLVPVPEPVLRWLPAILAAWCSVILSGCVETALPVRMPPTELNRLLAVNNYPLAITLPPTIDDTIGNQFVLIGLPLGSISGAETVEIFRHEIVTRLALAGFSPQPSTAGEPHTPHLTIAFDQLTLHAYDLLLTRRISCTLLVRGTLSMPGSGVSGPLRAASVQWKSSEHTRFAFSEQLGKAFRRCASAAAERLLSELRMDDVRLMPRSRKSATLPPSTVDGYGRGNG